MKKLLLLVLVIVLIGSANAQDWNHSSQDYRHSVSLLWGSVGYYNDFGVAYTQTTFGVNAYVDFKYSGYSGKVGQWYRHYTSHVGYVFELYEILDLYTAIGIHQENIYWYDEINDKKRQIIDSFNIGTGFLIRSKNRRMGWQQGFELDFVNGIGVNIVCGLIINF